MENLHQQKKLVGCKMKICKAHGEYNSKEIKFNSRVIETGCPMCAEESQKQQEETERQEKEQALKRKIEVAGITKRFKKTSFNNYNPVSNTSVKNLKALQAYSKEFKKVCETGSSLILCGTPGTGKTHLATALLKDLIKLGYIVIYTTNYNMIAKIKATYSKFSDQNEKHVIHQLTTAKLLVIDEVGVIFGSEADKILFYQVINGRYDNMLPTILISNLTQKELKNSIGERCFDRLKEGAGAVLNFKWDSYRR